MKRQTRKTKETVAAMLAAGWTTRDVYKKGTWWTPPGGTEAEEVRYASARAQFLRVPCENFGMAMDGPEPYRCGCVRKKGHRGQCRCKHGEILQKFG